MTGAEQAQILAVALEEIETAMDRLWYEQLTDRDPQRQRLCCGALMAVREGLRWVLDCLAPEREEAG